jgi:hypothetical protein
MVYLVSCLSRIQSKCACGGGPLRTAASWKRRCGIPYAMRHVNRKCRQVDWAPKSRLCFPKRALFRIFPNCAATRCGLRRSISDYPGHERLVCADAPGTGQECCLLGSMCSPALPSGQPRLPFSRCSSGLRLCLKEKGDLRDTMIAGVVLAYHAALATRNTAHFDDISAVLINPWAA